MRVPLTISWRVHGHCPSGGSTPSPPLQMVSKVRTNTRGQAQAPRPQENALGFQRSGRSPG